MAITLSITTIHTDGFTLSWDAGGAAGPFAVEFNRASDFGSDDTTFGLSAAGGSAAARFYGLPSSVPFYIRMRPVAGGAYSNTVFAATGTVALVDAYAGFSIDKAMLVVPVDIFGLLDTYGAGSDRRAGSPPDNLLIDDPQSTYQVQPVAGGAVDARLTFQTSGEPIDTIAMLGTNLNDAATWTIESAANAGGFSGGTTQTFRVSPTIGRRQVYHGLHSLAAATTNRFWRITINGQAIGVSAIMRNLVLGLARKSQNAAPGSGQGMNDMGSAQRTRFGTFDRITGWRGRTVDFDMQWLSEREFQTKWSDLPQLVGTTRSVLAVANSKRNVWLNDRLAFGTLTTNRGEVIRSSKSSASVEINSIY